MQILQSKAALRAALSQLPPPAFVPTMGNLHEGHLALVRQARECSRGWGAPVVASIFVNRLQFAPHEDFDRYPRTPEEDCRLLAGAGCDFVFMPGEDEMFAEPQRFHVLPDSSLADILEGEFRPGFFKGVCTIVLKLFALVQPRLAVFGRKDYQQWRIISAMAQQLDLPIEIAPGETARAADGLALSSRNRYLSTTERAQAPQLFQTLTLAREECRSQRHSFAAIEQKAMRSLQEKGWRADYIAIRRAADLALPKPGESEPLVILAAAWLGKTRLLDNLEYSP